MSICEALVKVLGEDAKKKLYEFENFKIKQIYDYCVKKASPKCVYLMHNKLKTYMKFFKNQEKGVLPFTYGKCVFSDMEYDDHNSVDLNCKKMIN